MSDIQLQFAIASPSSTSNSKRQRVLNHYRRARALAEAASKNGGDDNEVVHQPRVPRRYFDYLIVIDYECTCTEGANDPVDHEIVEFPAVLIDAQRMCAIDEFRTFVRPVRHDKISAFCTELTGIRQQDVDTAPTFLGALDLFYEWLKKHKIDVHRKYDEADVVGGGLDKVVTWAFVTDG